MEQFVIVDINGAVKRASFSKTLENDDNSAVELVIVCLPRTKQVVLFNRGSGASDMHNHWSLQSGKVNTSDLCGSIDKIIGTKLPIYAYKNAAVREFGEELNFKIEPNSFEFVDEFYMASKKIYFTLLSLALEESTLSNLAPNQSEVDKIKRFTIDEFESNSQLGDAIVFHKAKIVEYLHQLFG